MTSSETSPFVGSWVGIDAGGGVVAGASPFPVAETTRMHGTSAPLNDVMDGASVTTAPTQLSVSLDRDSAILSELVLLHANSRSLS